MNRVISRLGLTAVAIVAGSALMAQSSTTGAVSGVVTDNNGAALAGATITLTSSQISRTMVTGADGSFRLGLLNPGSWQIRVVKDGFQSYTGTVQVNTNDTRALSFKLPTAAETTVTITSSAAVVDPTSNTQGMNVNMAQLASVPKGRDFSSVAYFAPGVVDSAFGNNSPSMSGASGAENSYVVDGLDTKDYRYGFQGASLKTDFIDQVDIQTGGFKPEYSALGGVIVAVTKSGSNEFKGSAWATWDAVGIHAVLKKSAYAIESSTRTDSRYDVGAELGGAIIKDKLFYYVGLDGELRNGATPLPNNDPGLVGSDPKTTTLQFIGKLNWFITQDQQLTLFTNFNRAKFDQDTAYPLYGTANLGDHATTKVMNFNLSYDWTINSSLQLSAKLGYSDTKNEDSPSNTTSQLVLDRAYYNAINTTSGGTLRRPDLVNSGFTFTTGSPGLYSPLEEGKTTQAKVDLSWFLGTHTLKFGASLLNSEYTSLDAQTGPANAVSTTGNKALMYVVLNWDPANPATNSQRMYTQENNTDATVKTLYSALYAQDTWEMMPGFRVMYGARYEEQTLKDLDGNTFAKFSGSDYIQPRVGFSWDVNNDGKTVVAGSYATYFEAIPQRLSIRVFANEVYLRHYFRNQPSPTWNYSYSGTTPTINITNPTGYYQTIDFATPFSFDPIADGTKLPQRQEYTLGVDHQMDNGWALGLHGNYRKLKNPIEDSVITNLAGSYYDSGVAYAFVGTTPVAWAGQAILWNPGHYAAWTARVSPNSLNSGVHFSVPETYFDKAGNEYYSVVLSASKRTDRDFLNFNYTWSRLQGNYEGVVSSSNGQADGNITASFDYYPYVGYGLLPLDRTHVIKGQYSHRFTVANNDLNMGFAWTYLTGTPISAFDNTNDIGGYGNATPVNGQLGQFGRIPSTNQVDMHLDYGFKFGSKFRVMPSVDVFNLFNTRTVTGITQQITNSSGLTNPYYGHETGWQEGRRYRFGVKVQF
ncbi:MAG: TonB-dependent receptor [Acidobacteria bacterium]|nr:TonB-dependent receptor [Acidobacteriota bacterium]